ncbi:unnamed protein product [Ceutorhynchus assimilis]|uniref:Uncharacterized protein n=1 Tax=Ceutorhynchus assimilis TaxID=467358 RepID=A0A9N9QRZ7_9CUCU|nr:unnamed protein product [Ceutorhynchus assimilis]
MEIAIYEGAAINEVSLKRDERLEKVQAQMGTSLAALGKALSMLMNRAESLSETDDQLLEIIEAVSDGDKLLTDIYYNQSVSRQNAVSVNLDKSLKSFIENTDFDGWLFGTNLSKRLEQEKQIVKSGEELKLKVTPQKKPRMDSKNSQYPPGGRWVWEDPGNSGRDHRVHRYNRGHNSTGLINGKQGNIITNTRGPRRRTVVDVIE